MGLTPATIAAVVLAALLTAGVLLLLRKPHREGKVLTWNLGKGCATKIISNRSVASMQRLKDKGGILQGGDLVIVWAEQFLDDKILLDTVISNVRDGIRYLYVLDRIYAERFGFLLDELYKNFDDQSAVRDGIDVLFVESALTLSNHVLMAADTRDSVYYAGMIYDELPFAWVRQSTARAQSFLKRVKRLVATVGFVQYAQAQARETPHVQTTEAWMFDLADQLMDFSTIGHMMKAQGVTSISAFHYDLKTVVGVTTIPDDAKGRILQLHNRVRHDATG